MDRSDALRLLRQLKGQDLRALAERYEITVWKGGKKNKGWAGQVLERHLGLPLNSSRAPNFGSWELKVVPLMRRKDSSLRVKETMAVCMLDPVEVKKNRFEESHLFRKLQKMIVAARIYENQLETRSELYDVVTFDLSNHVIFDAVKLDYENVRSVLQEQGFAALSGRMGRLIQPRTKGPGHGSTSRAFYARTRFVAYILRLSSSPF